MKRPAAAISPGFDLARLRTEIKPFRLHWFPRLRGTNDHAAALRKRKTLYAPSIVLTGHQTAGRGRGAHMWWSDRGSLTVTFVLGVESQLAPHQLPLLAGLAIRDTAAELTGDDGIDLKWPNDILYGGKKLAGLLCERIDQVDLVGLGMNLNLMAGEVPAAIRSNAVWLSEISRGAVDPTQALVVAGRRLRRMLQRGAEEPFTTLRAEYDAHHALIGRKVRIHGDHGTPDVVGRCEGLDHIGRLVLIERGKTHRIISGRVSLG